MREDLWPSDNPPYLEIDRAEHVVGGETLRVWYTSDRPTKDLRSYGVRLLKVTEKDRKRLRLRP